MVRYFSVDDYARALYYSENCSFVNNDSNSFENDEIEVDVSYEDSKYKLSKTKGQIFINFKNDLDQENTIRIVVAPVNKQNIFFGRDSGILLQKSFNDYNIYMRGLDGCSQITIELEKDKTDPRILVCITNDVYKEDIFSISNLSIDFIINKIYEYMVNGDIDENTLETFNRSFKIVKPCLLLSISELVKNWTETVTKPAKETTDKIADIDKQLEELRQKQEELIKERENNQNYLNYIMNGIDSLYFNTENDYGYVRNK